MRRASSCTRVSSQYYLYSLIALDRMCRIQSAYWHHCIETYYSLYSQRSGRYLEYLVLYRTTTSHHRREYCSVGAQCTVTHYAVQTTTRAMCAQRTVHRPSLETRNRSLCTVDSLTLHRMRGQKCKSQIALKVFSQYHAMWTKSDTAYTRESDNAIDGRRIQYCSVRSGREHDCVPPPRHKTTNGGWAIVLIDTHSICNHACTSAGRAKFRATSPLGTSKRKQCHNDLSDTQRSPHQLAIAPPNT